MSALKIYVNSLLGSIMLFGELTMTEKFDARFRDMIMLYCPVEKTGIAHPTSGIPARYS